MGQDQKKGSQKAAIYIRVSTDAQVEEGYSIEAQKERLTAYCVSKGIKSYEYYIDGGFTGSNLDRPQIKRLIADAKEKRIGYVVVYKLDRLSRSQKDTLYLIEDVFNPNGVDFISINESMDTATPMGRLMLGILSAFAQLERENIRERTRMGMKERVKSGLWMGGGRIPFGYDYDRKQGILVPNADAETVRRIYRLYQEGYSAEKIAAMLDLKYDRLVMQILARKSNAGYIVYNGEEYLGKHEAIIPLEEYERTMALMEERATRKTSDSEHLLTGLVYCGKCGAKMRYQKWSKSGYKLVCYSQQHYKPYLIKDPDCDNGRPWADEIEEIVVRDLFQFSVEANKKQPTGEEALSPLDLLEKQLEASAQRLKRLYHLYASDTDNALLETIEEEKEKYAKLDKRIGIEREHKSLEKKMEQAKKDIKNLSEIWDTMTPRERKKVVRSVVKAITVLGEEVQIEYQF